MFELKDVTYDRILNIPRLSIGGNAITCLFGPSGCGKTTMLRLLNAMISPDGGSIFFEGRDLAEEDLVLHRRRVVMLPQQSTLFPGSVRDNLNIAAGFQDLPLFPDEALLQALKQAGLEKKSPDDNPELFSGGEKQRLCLSRILILKPPVLLLDEPGSALDESTEKIIMNAILDDQRARGSACVLVTHSREMAETYADTIVYMENGSVAAVESRKEREVQQ